LTSPRGERAVAVAAAAHVQSGNPPRADVKYQIEYSTDSGATWKPVITDWSITRRGQEPDDFWSQSLCWGTVEIAEAGARSVRVRFHNDGRRPYARCEAQLVYRTLGGDPTELTFDWTDDSGAHRSSHLFTDSGPHSWQIATGRDVHTCWVELRPRPATPGQGE
jgi:hypothetical protein